MARREHDREDLLREATALVERAELQVAGIDEPVVAGFRASGAASIFFGAEPVYQFTAHGQLRRGFVDAKLIKAERGRLITLTRERSAGEVQLLRRELSVAETAEHLRSCAQKLAALKSSLARAEFVLIGEVPRGAGVVRRIAAFLDSLADPLPIASSPHAR